MIMVSGHCGHPDTQAPDPDIDDSDQHDVMSSCLHTLYQYPAIDTRSYRVFTIYTSVLHS